MFILNEIQDVSFPVKGNQSFRCGQRVSVEVDMNSSPRKVFFFVDGEQQKNYVVGLPNKIRFFAFIQQAGSSFQITRSERLRQSSARVDADSVAWKWHKNWKQNNIHYDDDDDSEDDDDDKEEKDEDDKEEKDEDDKEEKDEDDSEEKDEEDEDDSEENDDEEDDDD
ncbi:MAG: hypothetical protein EZS28_023945 [Streblomastix strix]|uniref:SPRY domain-containing protein n=1 Tax=Streblomastix strix TaxID=222440 RepID=A0A5J4VDG3_9EUKA|nr:MAG: hypothetical protein EZS28_023945 [Streblomastix strix]